MIPSVLLRQELEAPVLLQVVPWCSVHCTGPLDTIEVGWISGDSSLVCETCASVKGQSANLLFSIRIAQTNVLRYKCGDSDSFLLSGMR